MVEEVAGSGAGAALNTSQGDGADGVPPGGTGVPPALAGAEPLACIASGPCCMR